MMENQSKESNALNLGDRGARIEELHNMLKSLNFEVTEPLDCFTEKTKNSIIKFQEQRGLPVSGQCDQKLGMFWLKIFLSSETDFFT
ncbi:MAG: hypothetical protein CM15mP49_24160 [Actinomycetota bacterium]|nr:MAG: hypothetical protein CM15mP49_24160 [Actinomycetota bacterium]